MSSPSTTIKTANRQAIISHLYHHGPQTKQMLERELGLSLPTITQNLRTLTDEGLVEQGEPMDSTGGRKAQTFVFKAQSHAAIGITMRTNAITMVAVDLYGNVIMRRRKRATYCNDSDYYDMVGDLVTEFAGKVVRSGSEVLGVAYSMQGIISADGTAITFGKIMSNTGLTLEKLTRHIELPAIMIHDSDASAMAELWFDHTIRGMRISGTQAGRRRHRQRLPIPGPEPEQRHHRTYVPCAWRANLLLRPARLRGHLLLPRGTGHRRGKPIGILLSTGARRA